MPITYLDVKRAEQRQISTADILWRTRDEGLIRLGDMRDDHLRNCALMLIGMGYQTWGARQPDDLKVRWLTILRLEWERRMRERAENPSAKDAEIVLDAD